MVLSGHARRLVVAAGCVIATALSPVAASAAAGTGSAAENYEIADLGTLGGAYSRAEAVNDRGDIVGGSTTAAGEWHAFLWSRGRMMDLGTLGGAYSVALDINNRGEVVGVSYTESGETYPFLWADGRMTALEGLNCSAEAINDRGQVIGNCWFNPVMWEGGRLTYLIGNGLGPNATIRDVNDAGRMVGGYPTDGSLHAYRRDRRGELVDLGTLGAHFSEAQAVNRRGEVAGYADSISGYQHAFFWSGGRMIDIGTLGGLSSVAYGLNDRGQVVGNASVDPTTLRAFVWHRGTMTDLGILPAGGRRPVSRAVDINRHGLIVGTSSAGGFEWHAVVWRPADHA